MSIRPIVLYPDPVLLAPTRLVEQVDDSVRRLVADMIETMYAAPGIGLAANQVGASLRLFVMDPTAGESKDGARALLNPVVLEVFGNETGEEGCLSFPDITLEIDRPFRARVEAMDLDGHRFVIDGEGLTARVMLHEIEHLEGETFLRNVSPLKRELVKREIRKRMKSGDWIASAAQ
jgi:peptide deformylase